MESSSHHRHIIDDFFSDIVATLLASKNAAGELSVNGLIHEVYRCGEKHGKLILNARNAQKNITEVKQPRKRNATQFYDDSLYVKFYPSKASSSTRERKASGLPIKTRRNIDISETDDKDMPYIQGNVEKSDGNPDDDSKNSSRRTTFRSNCEEKSVAGEFVYCGVVPNEDPDCAPGAKFSANVTAYGRVICVGYFHDQIQAAQAHDRAAIRLFGVPHCSSSEGSSTLNFPLRSYAREPLFQFSQYDQSLKRGLFGTSWKGTKPCDFGDIVSSQAVAFPDRFVSHSIALSKKKNVLVDYLNNKESSDLLPSAAAGTNMVEQDFYCASNHDKQPYDDEQPYFR